MHVHDYMYMYMYKYIYLDSLLFMAVIPAVNSTNPFSFTNNVLFSLYMYMKCITLFFNHKNVIGIIIKLFGQ